jgi:hypothetical protein
MMATGGFLARLSAPMLALIGVLVIAGTGVGGYYAYQTYDYVQHDNDFCMSCHLMEQPFEQFGKSEHRGLGCKACHQPNLIDRSAMALTQIVENPEEISVHAEVPNERCAECHVDGDPEKWRMIANSVGHRIHLESDDPDLDGLQCVECHSSGVHEFAPVDKTCAQSGCHEDSKIQLGGMSDLTIHCAACHNFVAPITLPGASREMLEAVILPDREECFSCHVMRTLAQMPDPDPHKGVCSSCHNPHQQETPREAVETCATAACHTGPDTLTAFHRGLPPGVLENCLSCHSAHDFVSDGLDCESCHTGIFEDSPGIRLPFESLDVDADTAASGLSIAMEMPDDALRYVHLGTPLTPAGVGVGWSPPQSQESPAFLHSEHPDLGCGNCHSNQEEHGGLTVRTLTDCRDCHHTDPVSRTCARCHEASDAPSEVFRALREMTLTVPGSGTRALPFDHDPHVELDCADCHTDGAALSAEAADCASCHEEHHDPDNTCASCHRVAPESAHPAEEAHVTCSGSGCHLDVPFDSVPRTREVCLGCHQDLRDHRPEQACSECHTLPAPRGGLELNP